MDATAPADKSSCGGKKKNYTHLIFRGMQPLFVKNPPKLTKLTNTVASIKAHLSAKAESIDLIHPQWEFRCAGINGEARRNQQMIPRRWFQHFTICLRENSWCCVPRLLHNRNMKKCFLILEKRWASRSPFNGLIKNACLVELVWVLNRSTVQVQNNIKYFKFLFKQSISAQLLLLLFSHLVNILATNKC